MKRWMRAVCIVCAAVLLLMGCACSDSSGSKNIKIAMDTVPTTLDPQLVTKEEQLIVVRNCFEGLFRATDGAIVPAACADYKTSSDSLSYTFTVKEGLKWSDGSTLTANDFAFGLMRSLLPETETPNVDLLFSIKNAEAFYKGKVTQDKVGIQAAGNTLTITLSKPDSELLQKLTYPFAMPCQQTFFEQAAGKYCMGKQYSICNGPYTLSSWDPDQKTLQLTRNDYYAGAFTAAASYITFSYDASANHIQDINDSVYDIAHLDSTQWDDAQNADLSLYGVRDTSWAVLFNPSTKTALSDRKVSGAMKQAIGMDTYQKALPTGFTATQNFVPTDFCLDGKAYHSYQFDQPGFEVDLAKAKEKFLTALEPYNGQFPAATMLYVDNDEMKALATAIVSVWQVELGAYINLQAVSESQMMSLMAAGSYQLALCPMTDTYGSATSFLSQFQSHSDKNQYAFASAAMNKALDQMLTQHGTAVVQTAEQAMMADSRVIPVAQSMLCYASSNQITGLQADGFPGHIDLFRLGK